MQPKPANELTTKEKTKYQNNPIYPTKIDSITNQNDRKYKQNRQHDSHKYLGLPLIYHTLFGMSLYVLTTCTLNSFII